MLEEKYTTLQADQALMVPKAEGEEDNDPVSEDTRRVAVLLEESTQKLIRQFGKRENQLLLKSFNPKPKDESEIAVFIENWGKFSELVTNWLNTPQEEVKSNELQRERLEQEVKDLHKAAKDAQEKYKRETAECKKRQEENSRKAR